MIVDQGGPVEPSPDIPLADPRTLLLFTILLAAVGWVALRHAR